MLRSNTKLEELLAQYRKEGMTPSQVAALASFLTARADAGLTQAQVAERMGTTQSAVARLESNLARNKFPSMRTLRKYAEAVGKMVEVRLV